MGPRFDELPGDSGELRDALLVVDEAVGPKDAAVAVIGVGTEANVAGDEEARKVVRYRFDRHRRWIQVTAIEAKVTPLLNKLLFVLNWSLRLKTLEQGS